jgi:hypothetical protein
MNMQLLTISSRPSIYLPLCRSSTAVVYKGVFSTFRPLSQSREPELANLDIRNHPIFKRLPTSLHKYAINFIHTPVSHVTSFLILHEVTAIVPLFGLWGLFHYLEVGSMGMPDWLVEKGVHFIERMVSVSN